MQNRLLPDGIPFDWRDRHPDLFTRDALKTLMESASGTTVDKDGQIVTDSGSTLERI